MSEEKNKGLKIFISGGIAGSFAKTLVAPIDRVKILLQVHNKHYENVGAFKIFGRVFKDEGFLSLYKGNGAQMLRIFPYAAIQFTSFESFKRLSGALWPIRKNNFFNNLLCGSLAGITAVSCTYPLDVIRSRLAFQYRGEEKYFGIIDALRKTYRENFSFKSFYRGYIVTIFGMIPYAGLSFSTFETLKHFVLHERVDYLVHMSSEHDDGHGTYELNVLGKLVCGGFTGALSQTFTYPLDVVRRHMQLEVMIENIKGRMGVVETFKYVYKHYGILKGFYRGITLNYLRAIPMVSTSFCFYEISKKFLGLETGAIIKLS